MISWAKNYENAMKTFAQTQNFILFGSRLWEINVMPIHDY